MALRVIFINPPLRYVEERDLPPLVAGRDLISDLSPRPSGERKEPSLSKQSKRPVCEEELLGGEVISEHLRPQMDSPR